MKISENIIKKKKKLKEVDLNYIVYFSTGIEILYINENNITIIFLFVFSGARNTY